ncbi:hypothetical protein QDR31_00770 [Acinetobacter baumannii]|uniref:hypothetical protein n=1 Tax=Acinetobacter baumannii TaxID=470 RepID=UPI00244B826F|nr:hypothetical protein [Acinetobacter baumannii]MDH2493624.1 hypothetical protein [Acinetobacter baumannii]
MGNFIVLNDKGNVVVDDETKNIGTVGTTVITTLPDPGGALPMIITFGGGGPSWYPTTMRDTRTIGIDKLDDSLTPMTIMMPNDGGFGAGAGTFGVNSGTLYQLRQDYPVSSGYLDVFNETGDLIWSAASAGKVPRVTQVLHFTHDELASNGGEGIEVDIGIGSGFLVDNIIGSLDINPGPTGTTARWFAMYWGYNQGKLKLAFKWRHDGSPEPGMVKALKLYGFNLFVFRFAG